MKITFLGTGTSTGVPEIGCNCEVCMSSDSRDKRLRSSILIDTADVRLVIDCTPDFRQQMLNVSFHKPDGVLITHEHYDHVGGIEDLRPYSKYGAIKIYAEPKVANAIYRRMPYCFVENQYGGIPNIELEHISATDTFSIKQTQIMPIRVMHHKLPILGFRIGQLAYLTDVKYIPINEQTKLENLDVLIISALRHQLHVSHQTLNEAIELARHLKPKKVYFTHMSHEIGLHSEVQRKLPSNYFISFDGMEIML